MMRRMLAMPLALLLSAGLLLAATPVFAAQDSGLQRWLAGVEM